MKKSLSICYLVLIFGILYIPILTLILFSFNSANSTANFEGFSLRWYIELFNSPDAFEALRNSLILAALSSLIATVIGTAAAEGIYKMKSKIAKAAITSVTNIPMMNPDIVTGVSMMLLFVAVATFIGAKQFLGFGTMLIAHVTFNLPYVLLSVMPRFNQLDPSLSEAAQDLGCTPSSAFFKVELPQIIPGIISGLMLGFTMSLDDFVISHFVSSPNFQTLPLYVYNQTVHNVKFRMYALCALIVFVILVILLAVNFSGSVRIGKRRKGKGVTR